METKGTPVGLSTLRLFHLYQNVNHSFHLPCHLCFYFFKFLFIFCFLGLHPQHMEVLGLGIKSELQLQAFSRATATRDPSRVYALHPSSRQRRIPNPLSEGRDGTRILMDPHQGRYR